MVNSHIDFNQSPKFPTRRPIESEKINNITKLNIPLLILSTKKWGIRAPNSNEVAFFDDCNSPVSPYH